MASVEEWLAREHKLVFEQSKLKEDMKFHSNYGQEGNLFPTNIDDYTENKNKESIDNILAKMGLLKKDTVAQQDEPNPTPTRLAVIGKNSEIIYSNHNCEFELSWQDNNRTLKIFINK